MGHSSDPNLLKRLEQSGHLVLTPSWTVNGSLISSYDDRYIVQYAASNGGIIVSNDNYRDIMHESTEMKKAVKERLLMYNFIYNTFILPNDPLGWHGPKLDRFLRYNWFTKNMYVS